MPHDWSALKEPFTFDEIHLRPGPVSKKNPQEPKTKPLAYIDARNVMERLDAVVGPENWEDKYYEARGLLVCGISIWNGERWVTKSDGAGDSDIEAEKGALSDAFKRAGVRWGIGRYLYAMDFPWVRLNPRYDKEIDPQEMPRLRQIYDRMIAGNAVPAAPSEALRELSDALTQIEPDACNQWMKDNLEEVERLSDTEKQVIKRMCAAKLAERQKVA